MPDIPEDLMAELLKTFQAEAAEHLQTLTQALLRIERLEDEAQRHEIVQVAFRAAHSLKGAARAIDLPVIESLAHSLENVLQQVRNTSIVPEPQVCDVLYKMLDAIQQSLAGQTVDIDGLQAQLVAAIDKSTQPFVTAGITGEKTDDKAAAAATTEPEESPISTVTDDTIRIAVSKLDDLLAQTGELLISKISAEQRLTDLRMVRRRLARAPKAWQEIKGLLKNVNGDTGQRLQNLFIQQFDDLQTVIRSLDAFEQALNRDAVRLNMVTTDLQDDVRRVRMLPFQSMALPLELAVRDVARTEGKLVNFVIKGQDVQLDKRVLETLKDPLLHLLRNAVSHGIELPEERKARGKPEKGHVDLIVRQRGSEISLAVGDDGRGFDLAALRHAQQQNGSESLEELNGDDAIALAFLPGITTARNVTAISGRGVGLDVVRQQVEDIHGRIAVHNVPGRGVTIELIVPSSITMTRGLMVRCGTEHFVLPLLSIERIMEVREVLSIGGRKMLRIGQASLPLVSLAAVLERPGDQNNRTSSPVAVIVSVAEQRLALLVDEVLSELELAVKPLGEPLRRVRNVAGAALLGNGIPIVVLNPGDIVRSARRARMPDPLPGSTRDDNHNQIRHILVVDDSITTRTMEKNILAAAGYHVTLAVDGVEALKRLNEHDIDLVVTDIQMPQMDGITLTRQIREAAEYKHLPIILVTSLESQEDREEGMLAGADAYIVKRGFNQATLLATIKKFLDE